MILVTAKEMRTADRQTIEEIGLPGAVLMENAAQGLAREVAAHYGDPEGLDVAAFCGKGNNGGDGLAALRILKNQGAEATAYLFAMKDDLTGDAALNLKAALACGVTVREIPDDGTMDDFLAEMEAHVLYLDALLGTGLSAEVTGLTARAIEFLNQREVPVVAVDIPSGLAAETGMPLGVAVKAELTVTFGLIKLGLALDPLDLAGEVSVVDISIPPRVAAGLKAKAFLLEAGEAAEALPERPEYAHKGDFGHLLVVGGSPGKSGAALLAAWGGLRAGAGLVTLGLPLGLNQVAETALLPAMSQPLPQTDRGGLALAGLDTILALAGRRQALVLGPGLGEEEESRELARGLVRGVETPLVLDADALNALVGHLGELAFASDDRVLTPHPGEAARLLGLSAAQVQADRPAAARRLARETGAVVVLKGARSVIAEPEGYLWVNPTGNVLLAAGGSGDVLAGLIGGLLAQGVSALEAACAGVYLHGLAADLAAVDFGRRGMTAQELLTYLPKAFAQLEGCGDSEEAEAAEACSCGHHPGGED